MKITLLFRQHLASMELTDDEKERMGRKEERTSLLWQTHKLAPKQLFRHMAECSVSGCPITRDRQESTRRIRVIQVLLSQYQQSGTLRPVRLLTGGTRHNLPAPHYHSPLCHVLDLAFQWSMGTYLSSQQQESGKPKRHKASAEDESAFIFTRPTSTPPNTRLHASHNLSLFSRLNSEAILFLSSCFLRGKKMALCCGLLGVYVIPSPATQS